MTQKYCSLGLARSLSHLSYADSEWKKNEVEFLTSRTLPSPNKEMSPPYGVVGPTCKQGNVKILTHDFTHRTHMEIFNKTYYPPELIYWWMDDWISRVYGSGRTKQLAAVEVLHHTGTHGQRYDETVDNKLHLGRLISEGKAQIIKYMERAHIPPLRVNEFRSSRFDNFPLNL